MKKSTNKVLYIFVVIFVAIGLYLYAQIMFNNKTLESLTNSKKQYEKELKQNENVKSALNDELNKTKRKGFIEKQAREQGFIMPNEEMFTFSNPNELSKSDDLEMEWTVPQDKQ